MWVFLQFLPALLLAQELVDVFPHQLLVYLTLTLPLIFLVDLANNFIDHEFLLELFLEILLLLHFLCLTFSLKFLLVADVVLLTFDLLFSTQVRCTLALFLHLSIHIRVSRHFVKFYFFLLDATSISHVDGVCLLLFVNNLICLLLRGM